MDVNDIAKLYKLSMESLNADDKGLLKTIVD